MRKLTYTNPTGDEIEFYLSPFLINSLEGIGEVEANTNAQNAPYQDGSSYIDSNLQPRFIDMVGTITKTNKVKIRDYRRVITRVCNPRLGLGKITFELDGAVYQIYAVPNNVPRFPERSMNPFQEFQVTWFCPNPYWQSLNNESKPLQAYVGNFKLPMTFPLELGTSGSRTTLYNDGDSPAPVEIEINGPITNPQIFNRTTGEFIRINRSISEGEKIIINTESGQKKVVVVSNGTESQAFGYLDAESTLFNLEIGENEIEHVADSGNRHAEVIVRWQNRYVGV